MAAGNPASRDRDSGAPPGSGGRFGGVHPRSEWHDRYSAGARSSCSANWVLGNSRSLPPPGRRTVFVAGGWVQVLSNEVRVLADRAEDIAEIDTVRAEACLETCFGAFERACFGGRRRSARSECDEAG